MFTNAKVIVFLVVAGIIGVIIVGMHLRIDSLNSTVSEEKAKAELLQSELDKCRVADKSKELSLAACNGNVAQIKAANDELQIALEQSRVYKKKWKQVTAEQAELPPPKDGEPCLNGGKIDEGHKAILAAAYSDLASYYSLRRKVKRPDANGSSAGTPKVLPPAPGVAR